MHHEQRDDQATSLRNQVEQQQVKYDASSLPPRSEVHQTRKAKAKWKISFPFIRFILLLFIVIILLVLTVKFWGEEYLSSAESEEEDHFAEQVFIKLNSSEEVNGSDMIIHEVDRMDTLFSISEKYYGNTNFVNQIKEANQLENDTLIVGEEIVIPNVEEN
ncbi:LysM peptidoglycan-binding domain-containing protein [Gracilibacillus lacisalsi]|uniref:LysM peptidoglycan-binding domain-containing protein n=1 Tax=Gracilibacillus lacisalsi TaxID=393087 RepID=UPI0003623029|nr:LysM peptidoglycan-binding domain-containing protein [Gracilibacillus lacisalsi]